MYHLIPSSTNLYWPSTSQYRHILTQYHQVPLIIHKFLRQSSANWIISLFIWWVTHSILGLVLHYNYNGEISQNWDLVITSDWGVLLTQGQCVWTAFCIQDLFRDTPIDHIWGALICIFGRNWIEAEIQKKNVWVQPTVHTTFLEVQEACNFVQVGLCHDRHRPKWGGRWRWVPRTEKMRGRKCCWIQQKGRTSNQFLCFGLGKDFWILTTDDKKIKLNTVGSSMT